MDIATFQQTGIFHHIPLKLLRNKFHENPSQGYRVFIVGQTRGQIETPTDVNAVFGYLPFATKNVACRLHYKAPYTGQNE